MASFSAYLEEICQTVHGIIKHLSLYIRLMSSFIFLFACIYDLWLMKSIIFSPILAYPENVNI